jgi:hypothetical protein
LFMYESENRTLNRSEKGKNWNGRNAFLWPVSEYNLKETRYAIWPHAMLHKYRV